MFNKIKLKPYLLTIFSILIALAGIIALTGILGLQNTKRNTDVLVNEVLNAGSAVKDCRIAANTAGRNLRGLPQSDTLCRSCKASASQFK